MRMKAKTYGIQFLVASHLRLKMVILTMNKVNMVQLTNEYIFYG